MTRLAAWVAIASIMSAGAGLAQSRVDEQRPPHLPGWPCTGKERAFDPSYLRVAEATGGQLLLLDRSETEAWTVLALTGAKHNATIIRGAGRMESSRDVEFPVDSAIESLFLTVSIQCMQTVLIYDPQGVGVRPELLRAEGNGDAGEDHWYRSARLARIPKPAAGMWRVRMAGTGAYSFAIAAQTGAGVHVLKLDKSGQGVAAVVSRELAAAAPARFQLLSAAGEAAQAVELELGTNGQYQGDFRPGIRQFRLMAEGVDGAGYRWWRTDGRLFGER
jgi:hypothetical protein